MTYYYACYECGKCCIVKSDEEVFLIYINKKFLSDCKLIRVSEEYYPNFRNIKRIFTMRVGEPGYAGDIG